MRQSVYNAVSLFSGCGGLDLGLVRTGRVRLLACVDASAACCETIERNRHAGRIGGRSIRVYQSDIRLLDPATVHADLGLEAGELDLLVGAPPCQSFSTLGKRGGVQDPRGQLIWDYLRFTERLRPRAFVLENVPGLMESSLRPRPRHVRPENGGPPLEADERPGSVFEAFVRGLPDGYRVDCFLVNAVSHGTPQDRQRVILVGNRLGRLAEFPAPTHGGPGRPAYRTLGDALAGLSDPHPVLVGFGPTRTRLLEAVGPGEDWRTLVRQAGVNLPARAADAGGRTGWYRRLSFDRPCPTVLADAYSIFSSLCHPTETRPLSLRERARVQELPDEWEFAGSVQERFAQVGNTVPVSLGRASGQAVVNLLDGSGEDTSAGAGHPPWRIVDLRPRLRSGKG